MEKENQENQIIKSRRSVEIFLLVIGISALILGFLRFNATINSAFNASGTDNKNFTGYEEKELQEILNQQNSDTDQDGLSDYDEINIYSTSPYLEDTDSDGYSDMQEINEKENPNCPRGQDCGAMNGSELEDSAVGISDLENYSDFLNQLQPPPENQNSSGSSGTGEAEKILSGSASAEEIRQMLSQAGIPLEEMEKISDADLIKMYYETIAEMGN
ncbi:hypothetical protein KAS41_01765 [Candidatus Parcubacteria bacterium]|nr:hypothetical protein [Candidatus Parcubacteria bacterium]